jgi:hypothetical protein
MPACSSRRGRFYNRRDESRTRKPSRDHELDRALLDIAQAAQLFELVRAELVRGGLGLDAGVEC